MIDWKPVATLPEKGIYAGWTGKKLVSGEPFFAFGPERDCLLDGALGKWWRITHWADINPPRTVS